MIDWNSVDWVLIWNIAGSTWGITVLVAAIAWLSAAAMGLAVHKFFEAKTEDKDTPGKDT